MLQTSSCSQKGHLRFKTCFHDLFFKHDVTLFKYTLFDLTNKLANILCPCTTKIFNEVCMFMRNARVSHGQSLKAEFINQFAGEDAVFRVRILKHATWTWHIKGLGSSSVLKIAGDLLFALGNITARELQLNTKNNPIIGFKYAVTVRKSALLSVDPFSIVS